MGARRAACRSSLSGTGASPAPPAGAQEFVARLYRSYEKGDPNPFRTQESVYSPELARQMRLNQKLHGDEVGLIDCDPVCQCQDMADLRPRTREGDQP